MYSKQNFCPFTEELTYVIKCENGTIDFSQKGWFLAVNKEKQEKPRTANSCYCFLLKPCEKLLDSNVQWKLISTQDPDTFKIVVASGVFEGYQLFAFNDIPSDKRDECPSYFAFTAMQNYTEKFNQWKFTKVADHLYIIQNKDSNQYLSAHRYYQTDKRNNESTWMITHADKICLTCWKVEPY